MTLAPEVQSTLTQSDYNMSSYGGYLTTEYTAAADVNTSGNLMYIDFQLANGMTAYSTTESVRMLRLPLSLWKISRGIFFPTIRRHRV